MKQFTRLALKAFVFLLSIFLVFSPILMSGEITNSGVMAFLQHRLNLSMLYGPHYSTAPFNYYKAEATRIVNPEVVILGDSRPLQIRDFFFDEDVSVYNAGFSAITTADMQYFLENQKNSNIKTVIVSLSHFSFNQAYQDVIYPTDGRYTDSAEGAALPLFTALGDIDSDVKKAEYQWRDVFTRLDSVGIGAKVYENGILNDGSYYYGDISRRQNEGQPAQERMQSSLNHIASESVRFQGGAVVNQDAVHYLRQFLQYCNDNGLQVIGFTPPYAPAVNNALAEKKDVYAYHYQLLELAPKIFKEYGQEFYDYTDTTALGCTDAYFLDGFHPSDVVMLRMFEDMIQRGSALGEMCNIDALQAYDHAQASPLQLLNTWQDYNNITINERGVGGLPQTKKAPLSPRTAGAGW